MLVAVVLLATAPAQAAPARTHALLELKHPHGLAKFVRKVSSPGSPRYRRYASVHHLTERYGASRKDRRTVRRWAAERGGHAQVLSGSWAIAAFPADSGPAMAASSQHGNRLHVPPALRGAVRRASKLPHVPLRDPLPPTPLRARERRGLPTNYPSARQRTGAPSGCAAGRDVNTEGFGTEAFTPNQYTAAYGISALHNRGFDGAGERIALIEIDGFAKRDIKAFASCFGTKVPPTHTHVLGGGKKLAPGLETTLDLSMLTASAPGVDRMDVYEGTGNAGIPQLLNAAITARHKPTVISSSIGACEPQAPSAYLDAVSDILAVGAGAGITFLSAAGDAGSADCNGNGSVPLVPLTAVDFPGSSPYATSVGGTNLILGADNHLKNEIVWNHAPGEISGGGGGTSIHFSPPWWQTKTRATVGGLARLARTVPDLAALGDSIPGYALSCASVSDCNNYGYAWIGIGGTSAATPLTAGGLALANQASRTFGQRRLGLINPLIYRLGAGKRAAKVFTDVRKTGNDVGTAYPQNVNHSQPLGCCTAGVGYDMASGWGSLRFPKFLRAAKHAYKKSR